jgi:aryl-alcohol dehydrogenase-like predicted oxidoreductase
VTRRPPPAPTTVSVTAASSGTSPGVDRLGLGLAALGRPVYITTGRRSDLGTHRSVDDLAARTAEVLDAAYDAGVRYVDCARSYGLSERFLASWLRDRPEVDDVTVASKWGYRYVGGWRADADVHEVKDHSAAALDTQLAETRAELGDRLAVYQVHSLTPESPALTDAGVHRRLGALRDAEVRVGFSTSGPRQADVVREALAIEVDGARLFDVVQSTWNLLEPSVGPALQEAADAGVRVVVKEGVANGRLAPADAASDDEVDHESAHAADEPARAAWRVADDLGVPLDRLALAAVLAQPWAGTVLSGAVTADQLRSNVGAAGLVLPAGAVDGLLAGAEPAERYWQRRAARAWA